MSWINRFIDSVTDKGKELLQAEDPDRVKGQYSLQEDCSALLTYRGDATALAMAQQILGRYDNSSAEEKLSFFQYLATEMSPDFRYVAELAQKLEQDADSKDYKQLLAALNGGRHMLFELLNIPGSGTQALVKMRTELLDLVPKHPELASVDIDLKTTLEAWFNRGFLEFREIDWHTSADILEKLISYEAVHEIQDWADLKRRLSGDRSCFAFFHPALPDDPLIFVQVGFTEEISDRIDPFLNQEQPVSDPARANTAIFYSISNCQTGLRGISFGNFLIKQVVQHIQKERPQITRFSTLSPIPGLNRAVQKGYLAEDELQQIATPWLTSLNKRYADMPLTELLSERFERLDESHDDTVSFLNELGLHYLTQLKRGEEPYDPVARFHLSNGASIYRINPFGNRKPHGMKSAAGLMVNYLYDLERVEMNHESFKQNGTIDIHPNLTKSKRRLRVLS
ncbi:malonyl-CoA decarboxylase family protein [Neptuniibacter sp.]|uniref:malonyl-CoA decarboxylase domain-containing protein n=1 Tax=Neptuniibacter sp. TaxID=1962643 RepID=UPI0026174522|nr:malonyl-CoA decarboxylase family protein [Neptuniibacter sp.]MCP4596376.1 malonyl-CoA decarboxylase [Neptuniibacter sp.]